MKMGKQQYAVGNRKVLLNILGILRWAEPAEQGGWDVQSTYHNGTYYQEYHTYGGTVVWDVSEKGSYPDQEEYLELERIASA